MREREKGVPLARKGWEWELLGLIRTYVVHMSWESEK